MIVSKPKTVVISTIIFIFVLGILSSIVLGTPWGKWSAKERFLTHLQTKYEKEFVIDKISYDFLHGGNYHAYASATDEPEISFYIGENSHSEEIDDAYSYEMMRFQGKQELSPIIKKHFEGVKRYSVEMHPTEDAEESSTPLDYKENAKIELGIGFESVVITAENEQQEIEKAGLLLLELKEKGINFEHFGVSYQNKTLQLSSEIISTITEIEDLKPHLVSYTK